MSTKRKALALVKPVVKPSAKVATKSKIDETRTAVSTGPAVKSAPKAAASAPEPIEISSDSSSHYSDSDNEDVNSDNEATEAAAAPEKKTKTEKTTKPATATEQNEDDNDDDASPTFGDLARGNATIDVASALAAQEAASAAEASAKNNTTITVQRASGQTSTISATSLGTVLNQALRTDDSDLLESCLQTSDPKIITNTITRMDSALAGVLLSKLAARMHRRPGRAFGLMKWIQTTLVAHGGSLVAQPEVVARLGELNRVLEERARGLPALLALKGKLDMLDQQMRWRKFVKQGGAAAAAEDSDEEEEEDVDEPGVVYVEGEETEVQQGKSAGAEEDFALIDVGADGESDEEEGDEDEDDEEDDEEFDDAESLDEDEVDHDDVEESGDEDEDDEEEEEDDEDEAPPAKVQKTSSSKFNKRK